MIIFSWGAGSDRIVTASTFPPFAMICIVIISQKNSSVNYTLSIMFCAVFCINVTRTGRNTFNPSAFALMRSPAICIPRHARQALPATQSHAPRTLFTISESLRGSPHLRRPVWPVTGSSRGHSGSPRERMANQTPDDDCKIVGGGTGCSARQVGFENGGRP